ncbi:MAG: DNRLRE domain-containing protein, partial [Planctomycetes bacterium]|nr:DNRLRE domain-containing protein [Planctomycetota bacterium]
DGATRDFYNRAAGLTWDNYMGDWRDSAGVAQGSSAYATSTLIDDDTPGFQSWDVTSLVDEWRAGAPNQGFYLRQVSGSGPFDFYSREHPVPGERPSLNVVTDAGTFVLPPITDTGLRSSSFGSPGDAPTFRIKSNSNSILSRFDLSVIPEGASVTNATFRLFSFAEFGSSSMDVGVFRVFNDPGGVAPVVQGLAQGFQGDAGIGAHPDVYVYTDFESADWGSNYKGNTNGSTLQRVTSSPGFEPIGNSALRVTIPAGEHYGMNVQYDFSEQIGAEPTEVFFRYYARFDDNWNPGEGGREATGDGRPLWRGRVGRAKVGWHKRMVCPRHVPHHDSRWQPARRSRPNRKLCLPRRYGRPVRQRVRVAGRLARVLGEGSLVQR